MRGEEKRKGGKGIMGVLILGGIDIPSAGASLNEPSTPESTGIFP